MDHALDEAPLWILLLALLLALLAAREGGAWISRKLSRDPGRDDSERGYILSGVLGLLALLIAFTFGLALDRYQTRRDLVVDEANAIGTADMRARLLDAPYAGRLSGLLRSYAETRLRYGETTGAEQDHAQAASADLRALIQTEAINALRPIGKTPLPNLVAPAINQVLDLGVAREAAHAARIPTAVIVVLVVYVVISAGVIGAATSASPNRRRLMTALMFLLLTLALGLILDLDRPRTGAITVSQVPMAELVKSLRSAPPP